MSRRNRRCPTCGSRRTHPAVPVGRDRELWQCLDAYKRHAKGTEVFPYFDRKGPVTRREGSERLGYREHNRQPHVEAGSITEPRPDSPIPMVMEEYSELDSRLEPDEMEF